jgi:hypothetical protein
MDFLIVERRWAMARSPIDNHVERSHNPATLTRQRDETPCSERFPVPDGGRVRRQDSTASHGQASACWGGATMLVCRRIHTWGVWAWFCVRLQKVAVFVRSIGKPNPC